MIRPTTFCSLALVLAGAAVQARAASIDLLSVSHSASRYTIEMRVELGVPARRAYAVFANLEDLRTLNPDVQQAKVLSRGPDGTVELYSVIRACVLWYCRSLRETQRMKFVPSPDGGEVYAKVLPQGGDFRNGRAHWMFRGSGTRTILEMTAEFEPAFRVPPLIGPWLVKRWLRREIERTAANLGRLSARGASSSDARTAR